MTEDIQPRRRISVVIRAYNESRHIGRLLAGLRQQTVLADEIILVDSGSTDSTVEIAQSAGCKIVRIPKSQFSFGRALNWGCEAAQGDVLLLVSAHVYPIYDTYVEHLMRPFDRPEVAVSYGRQVGDERTKFSESRVMLKWFPKEGIPDQPYPFCNNANAAISKSVWQELRYDESLTGLEDIHFAQRVLEIGCKISYVANAPVVHVHEESWGVTRNRYRREAIAYARIVEGSEMPLKSAVILAVSNTARDYADAFRRGRLRGNLASIPLFRSAQFLGAWEGFRGPEYIPAGLLERFYYPADDALDIELNPTLGRKLVYGGGTER